MRKFARRLAAVIVVALSPMAVVTVAIPGVSSAQCENGWWWNPVTNVCRPPLVTTPTPLVCEYGWWWDPVTNVCQPPLLPPPP
jgi:hypothetical protein